MRKMADPLYFKVAKYKQNQANTSSTCGPFALRFIADMYAGRKFKVATRFTDEHVAGVQEENTSAAGVTIKTTPI